MSACFCRSRLEKNRQAAALSRSRQKDLISSLQKRVAFLEHANLSMGHALAVLQAVRLCAEQLCVSETWVKGPRIRSSVLDASLTWWHVLRERTQSARMSGLCSLSCMFFVPHNGPPLGSCRRTSTSGV